MSSGAASQAVVPEAASEAGRSRPNTVGRSPELLAFTTTDRNELPRRLRFNAWRSPCASRCCKGQI